MQDIVQTMLQKMGNVSKPQFKIWPFLLTTILVVCGKVNFTNLSYGPSARKPTADSLPKSSISVVSIQS